MSEFARCPIHTHSWANSCPACMQWGEMLANKRTSDFAGCPKHPLQSAKSCQVCVLSKAAGEVRVVDPDTGGMKGQKPERFDLIPFDALEVLARVYGKGAEKYEDDNWRKGYSWRLSYGAMLRHISRWIQREDYDKETGLHHLAHAAWHCLTLIVYQMRGLGKDDRP